MDKKLLSLIILLFGIFSTLSAQEDNRITIKGVVVDATTGEPIPFEMCIRDSNSPVHGANSEAKLLTISPVKRMRSGCRAFTSLTSLEIPG